MRQVNSPTSSPYVTSVGGTSLAIGKTSNYQWETSWGTMQVPLGRQGRRRGGSTAARQVPR